MRKGYRDEVPFSLLLLILGEKAITNLTKTKTDKLNQLKLILKLVTDSRIDANKIRPKISGTVAESI